MSDSSRDNRPLPGGATQTFDQLAAQRDPLLGQIIGNYHLLAFAGEGTSGRVYRARDVRLDRDVAVKVLRTTASRERFELEARALARLSVQPGVVDVYAWGEHDGQCYLALEYLPESAASLLSRRPAGFDPALAVTVGIQCARALAAAHRAGVVHGDIKPSNVLLDTNGTTAKLCDFGLASLSAQAPLQGGTPAYLAPECAAGASATPSSDIYSLGATIYALLAGAPPVPIADPTDAISATASGKVRPLAEVRPGLAPALVDVVSRSLSADPALRYADADAFAAALQASSAKDDAPAPGPARKALRPFVRLALATAAVLCAGFVVMLGQSMLPGGGGGAVVLADARLQLNGGNYAAARKAFEQYLDAQPDSTEARYGLAYSFLLEGDQEHAATEFAQLGERTLQAEGKAAVAYMASGEKARPALEQAANDAPGGYASVLLAMLDMMAGDFETAQQHLDGVREDDLKFDWQRRQYLQTLGQIHFKSGDFDGAEKIFARLEQGGGGAAADVASDYAALSRERAGATERQEVSAQIARLKALMKEQPPAPDADTWSSRPLRIWIPPVEAGEGVIMQETGLADVLPWRLARGLTENPAFPLTPVERSVQGAILAEQEFSAALSSGENALQLGRVLGAKLLLTTKVSRLFNEELLHVTLVDTETTRPTPVGEYTITRDLDPKAWMAQLQDDIVNAAARAYPVRGKLTPKGAEIELNVGADVGVKAGMRFKVIPSEGARALDGVEAVASGKIEAASAVVALSGAPASSIPATGWLVEALRDDQEPGHAV